MNSDKATIHKDVYIGPNVCIGPNCLVEQNVVIHSNCSLVKDVSIDSVSYTHLRAHETDS